MLTVNEVFECPPRIAHYLLSLSLWFLINADFLSHGVQIYQIVVLFLFLCAMNPPQVRSPETLFNWNSFLPEKEKILM